MPVPCLYLSIVDWNADGLNFEIKRHSMAEWINKQDPSIYCLNEAHFTNKDTQRLKVKEWKKYSMLTESKTNGCRHPGIRQNRLYHQKLLKETKKFII